MGIILTILKIIGIILLIILALVLAIVLIILFVPIRYEMGAEKIPGGVNAEGCVSWLFGAVKVKMGFFWTREGGRKVTRDIYIFGISRSKVHLWRISRQRRKAEEAYEKRKAERIRRLERLQEEDPEAYERERQMALARRRERMARQAGQTGQAGGQANAASAKEEPGGYISAAEYARRNEAQTNAAADDKILRSAQDDRENTCHSEERSDEESRKADEILRSAQDDRVSSKGTEDDRASTVGGEAAGEDITNEEIAEELGDNKNIVETPSNEGKGGLWERIKEGICRLVKKVWDICLKIVAKIWGLLVRLVVFLACLPSKLAIAVVKIYGKVLAVVERVQGITGFLNDPRTRAFIRMLFSTIRKLLAHAFPKKIWGYLRFGLPDPAWTGIATGAIGWIYPMFRGNFRLEPVFDEKVIDGNIRMKGRIYVFYPAFLAVRLIFNENTKFVIRTLKKKRH